MCKPAGYIFCDCGKTESLVPDVEDFTPKLLKFVRELESICRYKYYDFHGNRK